MKRITKHNSNQGWHVRLRSVLKEKGISLRQAASIAGVAHSVLDSWSAGAAPNDLIAVKRLCNALQISFSWLLTGERETQTPIVTVAEVFDSSPFFDGYARIRIDRLLPNFGKEKTSNKDDEE